MQIRSLLGASALHQQSSNQSAFKQFGPERSFSSNVASYSARGKTIDDDMCLWTIFVAQAPMILVLFCGCLWCLYAFDNYSVIFAFVPNLSCNGNILLLLCFRTIIWNFIQHRKHTA